MALETGQKLPDTTIHQMVDGKITETSLLEWSSGRKVVLIALPGAFTPTCSARHLPGFVEKADALKAKGVDEIACLSVNDGVVMGAWGKDNGAEGKVTLLADGNAEFTTAVGLTMDGSGFGMGTRSQRYAMVVKDGVVEHLFIEEPGAFEVSSADHMLEQLG